MQTEKKDPDIEKRCKKCQTVLQPGIAMVSTLVGEEDDIGGLVTLSPGGPGRLVDCNKCPECGFSVIPAFRPVFPSSERKLSTI